MLKLAKAEAQKIIDYYAITLPEEINLEIILAGFGIIIEEKEIDGSEGRIRFPYFVNRGVSGLFDLMLNK